MRRRPALPVVLGLLATITASSPVGLAAQWTEADVARLAAERSPEALVASARAAAALADANAAGRYPDPGLDFERAETFGVAGQAENTMTATVPLDLGGARAAARALARADAALAEADAAAARREAVTLAVLAFYDAVEARARLELAREAETALAEATRVVERRVAAGGSAGYERTRLELESELARSATAMAELALAEATRVLLALVAPDLAAPPELVGSLETEAPEPLERLLARAADRPALRAARGALEVAEVAVGPAERAWIPRVDLTGGGRVDSGGGPRRAGYVVGLSLRLPVFSGSQGLPERARAHRALAEARVAAAERRVALEVSRAHARLLAARAELARFREATAPRLELLLRGAETAYREGAAGVYELLDARRAATAVRSRQLALAAEAKRAEVALAATLEAWE